VGQWIQIVNPDPDTGRLKISPKKEGKRNFVFEELFLVLDAFLESLNILCRGLRGHVTVFLVKNG
jgi:hypothetical protein